VIADLMPLKPGLAPFIQPGCLGNDKEERRVQVSLIQLGNR